MALSRLETPGPGPMDRGYPFFQDRLTMIGERKQHSELTCIHRRAAARCENCLEFDLWVLGGVRRAYLASHSPGDAAQHYWRSRRQP